MDAEFKECFQHFWTHLADTDEVRFELLEPPRGMVQVLTVLCQGYLLAHARVAAAGEPGVEKESGSRAPHHSTM